MVAKIQSENKRTACSFSGECLEGAYVMTTDSVVGAV